MLVMCTVSHTQYTMYVNQFCKLNFFALYRPHNTHSFPMPIGYYWAYLNLLLLVV